MTTASRVDDMDFHLYMIITINTHISQTKPCPGARRKSCIILFVLYILRYPKDTNKRARNAKLASAFFKAATRKKRCLRFTANINDCFLKRHKYINQRAVDYISFKTQINDIPSDIRISFCNVDMGQGVTPK